MKYSNIQKVATAFEQATQHPEGGPLNTINNTGFPDIRQFSVIHNADPIMAGYFKAVEYREDNTEDTRVEIAFITYTSPYLAGEHSGMVMIPEVGTKIIAVKPIGSTKFFYIGSILDIEAEAYNWTANPDEKVKKQELMSEGQKIYSYRGVPQQYVISSPKKNKIVLSDRNKNDKWDVGVKLESMSNQAIELNSSPGIDSVEMRNEHGDYLRVTSNPGEGNSPIRGLESNVQGSIDLATRNGDATLSVEQGGQELSITNKGNGAVRTTEDHEDESPGMVKVESWYKDINVFANRGNIFIEAQKDDPDTNSVVIEIMSNGKIGIHAASSIDIKCTDPVGVIHIESPASIDVKSGGSLNIQSTGDMNLKSGGNMNIQSGETVYIDGNPNVHLNNGSTANPAVSAADRVKSFYERISLP